MPFINQSGNTLLAVFGRGDLGISLGRIRGQGVSTALAIEEVPTGEIGRDVPQDGEPLGDGFFRVPPDDRAKLVLQFEGGDSLDVVIRSLQTLRRSPAFAE